MRRRTGNTIFSILVIASIVSVLFFTFTPRCQFGISAVHRITHWISFSQVNAPVTVKMLIDAETRPYLNLINATFTPTPTQISSVKIHFHPGDAGQRGLLVTWIIEKPITVVADFRISTQETRYVSPILTIEDSNREEIESTQYYPSDDSTVQKAVEEVESTVQWRNNVEKARAAYNWIRKNILYDKHMTDDHSPINVLHRQRADSEGIAYTFATLCRALGVPARIHYGNVMNSIQSSFNGIFWEKHCWAEFWDGSNWQPVDPTLGRFGSLSISQHIHSSFGIWSINVFSKMGMVWPVNRDGRIVVSGCGLDWSEFIGYQASTLFYSWVVMECLGSGILLFLIGKSCRERRLSDSHVRLETPILVPKSSPLSTIIRPLCQIRLRRGLVRDFREALKFELISEPCILQRENDEGIQVITESRVFKIRRSALVIITNR